MMPLPATRSNRQISDGLRLCRSDSPVNTLETPVKCYFPKRFAVDRRNKLAILARNRHEVRAHGFLRYPASLTFGILPHEVADPTYIIRRIGSPRR
jgi:hypothetical protein